MMKNFKMKLVHIIALIFIVFLVTIGIMIDLDNDKHNAFAMETTLIETIRDDTLTIHIVEVGEHRYSINVWGDDFEYTSAKHADNCSCKKIAADIE